MDENKLNLPNKRIDWVIFIAVLGLMFMSLSFVFSASAQKSLVEFGYSAKFLSNHVIKVLIGIACIFIFAKFDYHFFQRYSKALLLFSIIPLVLVFFVSSPQNNVYRWIDVGPLFSFQPSELAKFTLIIHISAVLTERQKYIKSFRYGMMPSLVWITIIAALIAIQPNFSNAFAVYAISLCLLFIGNVKLKHLLYSTLGFAVCAIIYGVSAEYRMARLRAYFSSSQGESINKFSYQTSQALLAFGNGGITGLGTGQSRQSNLFLPESFGDFIFAIIGEEYGYIGVVLIIAAFIIILWRGMKIAKHAPDMYGYFLASGIVITFAIYALINAGVNCGILPNTGVPMPFISYGGTAIIIYAIAIGILLNISSQSDMTKSINRQK